jgi:hypothetical protein
MDGMDRGKLWVSVVVGSLCFINLTFASIVDWAESEQSASNAQHNGLTLTNRDCV